MTNKNTKEKTNSAKPNTEINKGTKQQEEKWTKDTNTMQRKVRENQKETGYQHKNSCRALQKDKENLIEDATKATADEKEQCRIIIKAKSPNQ